jgi:hypothetical protein
MPMPLDVAGGLWVRFDSYEVRDGYIRPEPGAQLETYDPWEAYRSARATRAEQAPPYQSLLTLVESLSLEFTAQSAARVAAWCTEHGLLGVLLQRAQVVALQPRFIPVPSGLRVTVDGRVPASPLWPAQAWYYRAGIGWAVEYSTGGPPGPALVIDMPDREGQLVPEEALPSNAHHPHVLLQELQSPRWSVEPLGTTWARFFPAVPESEHETFAYPMPRTREFWEAYAEPVEDFLAGAGAFYRALAALRQTKPRDQFTDAEAAQFSHGLHALHTLVAPVRPVVLPWQDGSLQLRWLAPSLLASFAMMAVQDLTEHRQIRSCERCGGLFASAAYQARYCSTRCRQTAQKRTYRRRQRGQVASEGD